MDKDKNDLSAIIRGRLYAFKEVLTLPEELDKYDQMKMELMALENEGFTPLPGENIEAQIH